MAEDRNKDFNQAMLGIYQRAKAEAGYTPSVFFRMIDQHGGLGAAKRLINASNVSEGYIKLFELGRIDLTVEAVIVDDPRWQELFTEEEIKICHRRLNAYGYKT